MTMSTPAVTRSVMPDQRRVVGIVGDDVRLDHADRLAFEYDDVVICGIASLDRRQVVGDHALVRPVIAPPATCVRALEPLMK